MRVRCVAAGLALCLALPPRSAAAQAYQCRVPGAVAPQPRVVRDGPVRRTAIAGYTLALSWSPEYCRTRATSTADRFQCGGRSGRFGLMVHGLWPQARAGSPPPQWCAARPAPSSATVRRHLCTAPSPRLIAREWAKHGTCTGLSAAAYWARAERLFAGLRLPDLDRLSRRRPLTIGDLRTEFVTANPGWPRAAVAPAINRRGWLEDIRLCYDRTYRPMACPDGRRGPADRTPMKIWRGL